MPETNLKEQSARSAMKSAAEIVNEELDEAHQEIRGLRKDNESLMVEIKFTEDQIAYWQRIAEVERINKLKEMDKTRDSIILMVISLITTFVSLGILVLGLR